MTTIDFRTDPVTARRNRVVSLVTHADIPDIVWADDETGCYAVGLEMLRAIGSSWSGLDRSRSSGRRGDHARSCNAELWERTTLVISEERAAVPRA